MGITLRTSCVRTKREFETVTDRAELHHYATSKAAHNDRMRRICFGYTANR
jgi:hypothetical protein